MDKNKLITIEEIRDFIESLKGTNAWKKLQDKTQVFNTRVDDAVKSRGSHSDDVGEIAAALAEGLTDDIVKIEKARLLGRLHDVGHIPFGHAGESVADAIIKERFGEKHKNKLTEEQKKEVAEIRKLLYGEAYTNKNTKPGFEHNENSVLQYIMISDQLGYEIDREIIEGILSHSTSRYTDLPPTLIQQAVRLADKIAYINYDTQDLKLSFEGKEEWEALKKIYARPILDEEGNAIEIEYSGKKYRTVLEFLEGLQTGERISIFINEAIKMAKEDKARNIPIYASHETILTGGNDIIVELSQLKKNKKYYDKETNEWTPEGISEKKKLKKTLIEKSPILYLAYEMKERSDEFIRAGTDLPLEQKKENAKEAKSAVGNHDLRNQYIYNKLVALIEKKDKIDLTNIPESAREIFENLYKEYEEYKIKQENIIRNLPGNEKGLQYPEIYTILNFIGTHSNSDLLELANDLGLNKLFEKEVLSELELIISNENFYNKETATFTKEGIEERDKIVAKYGAFIKFRYGMDEYDFTPTTSQKVIDASRESGFKSEDELENPQKKQTENIENKISNQEKLDRFRKQEKTADSKLMEVLSKEKEQSEIIQEEIGVSRGR